LLDGLFGNKFFFIVEGWGFSAGSRGKARNRVAPRVRYGKRENTCLDKLLLQMYNAFLSTFSLKEN
jgi:hypothetical protein